MEINRQLVGKCIKCEEDVYRITSSDGATLMEFDGAACIHIHGGYGSSMDLTEFRAMICDTCSEDLLRRCLLPEYRGLEIFGKRGLGGNPPEWSAIDGLFQRFKDLWAKREQTEEGRRVNQKLLDDRGGKHLWPEE